MIVMFGGAVQTAAATAEIRTMLVHSGMRTLRLNLSVATPANPRGENYFVSLRRGKLGPYHLEDFSKFGHSSEFQGVSLEDIENLVLNLRPGRVYLKTSFRHGPSFSSLIYKSACEKLFSGKRRA